MRAGRVSRAGASSGKFAMPEKSAHLGPHREMGPARAGVVPPPGKGLMFTRESCYPLETGPSPASTRSTSAARTVPSSEASFSKPAYKRSSCGSESESRSTPPTPRLPARALQPTQRISAARGSETARSRSPRSISVSVGARVCGGLRGLAEPARPESRWRGGCPRRAFVITHVLLLARGGLGLYVSHPTPSRVAVEAISRATPKTRSERGLTLVPHTTRRRKRGERLVHGREAERRALFRGSPNEMPAIDSPRTISRFSGCGELDEETPWLTSLAA
jgi:hypothetical protein